MPNNAPAGSDSHLNYSWSKIEEEFHHNEGEVFITTILFYEEDGSETIIPVKYKLEMGGIKILWIQRQISQSEIYDFKLSLLLDDHNDYWKWCNENKSW